MAFTLDELIIQVYPDASSADAQRALAAWLRTEDQLRGRIRGISSGPAGPPGEMTGVAELLTVAVGSSGAVAVLVRSIATWLAHRSVSVHVKITTSDGWATELDLHRTRDERQVNAIIEAVTQAIGRQAPSS